jgi:predicted SnoaL-like aldol condensation-catalyzing enzyme
VSKTLAREFYASLHGGDPARAAAEFLAPGYVEHQASAGFTRDGLLRYARERRASYPARSAIVHRAIAQDDLVFLHVEERLDARLTVARGELFRVAGGRIAEHWSAHVIDKQDRKNPHGTFDGPDVDLASDTATRHLARFDALDRRGFGSFEFDAFELSRTARYIQHSPTGADTVQGLVGVLAMVRDLGIRMSIDVKRNLAEGDFIVTHRLYRTHPPFPAFRMINVFDLFRITEQGQADEHWDVMEEIESEAQLASIF